MSARPPMPIFVIVAVVLAVLCGAWIPLEPLPIESVIHAITSDSGGAIFGHALIAAVIFGGLLSIALRKRVLPLPQPRLLIPLALMGLALIASILFSDYKHLSLTGLFEWLAYGGAFILTVGTVGRGIGVRAVLAAMAGALSLLAVHGILEWIGSAQGGNPSWRIFAHTLGPNVAAAFFLIGAVIGAGLMVGNERLGNLLSGVGSFLCLTALLLTGSKGGVLAAGAALAALVLWMLLLNLRRGLTLGVGILAVALVAFGFTNLAAQRFTPTGTAATSRIAQAGESQEQSAGFRKLLWSGTAKLIVERPQGYGLGTYRFYSAKPGLTTQTRLAHNSFLQLAMEASPVALIAFLWFLILLAVQVLRGTRSQPPETQMSKAAVVAAILALCIHSLIDSDLHVFGVGVLFFVLCGLAVQLSSDLSAPEFLHPGMRNGTVAVAILAPLALLYFGVVDLRHGLFLTPKEAATPESIRAELDSLVSFAPLDSRVAYTDFRYSTRLGAPPSRQVELLKRAIHLGPTLPMLRAMAKVCQENKGFGDPNVFLDRALQLDPNNLLALEMKLETLASTDPAEAEKVANRMVEIEGTPYFQVRSLPEIVTLESYRARAYLAARQSGETKADLLSPAVSGYREYALVTTPKVLEFAKAGMDGGFGGISIADAKANLEFGKKLVEDYSSVRSDELGRSASAAIDVALASLSQ